MKQQTPRLFIRLGLLTTLLVGTATRFYQLGFQSFWSDEGNSLALAQAGFTEIAQRTAFDIHPPLYYWLLKVWLMLFGQTEFALRSLSAFLGVLLIALIFRLGQRLFNPFTALVAAFIAALSPFQIYYAQEARMYLLLTLLGGLTVWFAVEAWQTNGRRATYFITGYIVWVTLGLYTQYAFPLILAAINLTAFWLLWSHRQKCLIWIGAQMIPLLLYLPWLPIAYRQITTWPSLVEQASMGQIGLSLLQHISLGLSAIAVANLWLLSFGAVALLGIYTGWFSRQSSGRPRFAILLILFWLMLPAGVAAFFFRPAYLKIFLMASPAFCLLLGVGLTALPNLAGQAWGWLLTTALLATLLWPNSQALATYYYDPSFHRDNYRGIAHFIQAVGTADDAIIILAPGQQDVFGYYFPDKASQPVVHLLPQQRPLDVDSTVAQLKQIAGQAHRIYGVYWATEEADPDGLIEGWLNQHTFKARDIWFGHVRLVSYATANKPPDLITVNQQFGEAITLTNFSLSHQQISPAEILQIQLVWQTAQPMATNYTVFLQLLDEANYLIGQRDASPLSPTSSWQPTQSIIDNHGLYIEPGTPPGSKRLIVGLYNSTTGERLKLDQGGDFMELGRIEVSQRQSPLPIEAYQMQKRLSKPPLLGYDLYKRGFASSPDTPLYSGDLLHLNLYWQKSGMDDSLLIISLVDSRGQPILNQQGQPAGINYPVSNWATGEIVRGQFDLLLNDVPSGGYTVEVTLGERLIIKTADIQIVQPK